MEYEVTLLLPKKPHPKSPGAIDELKGLKDAMNKALMDKFACKLGPDGKTLLQANGVPLKYDSRVRDGDTEQDSTTGAPRYEGMWFVKATEKPSFNLCLIDGKRNPVSAASGWQSGDWGIANVQVFAWEWQGAKGVSLGLRGIQFIYKDEPFGQGAETSASPAQFDEYDTADAPADSEQEVMF